jgi:hypothetical protein
MLLQAEGLDGYRAGHALELEGLDHPLRRHDLEFVLAQLPGQHVGQVPRLTHGAPELDLRRSRSRLHPCSVVLVSAEA